MEEALLLLDAAPRVCLRFHIVPAVGVCPSKAFPFDCFRCTILGR